MNPNDIRPPRPPLPPRSPRAQQDPPPRKFAFPSDRPQNPTVPIAQPAQSLPPMPQPATAAEAPSPQAPPPAPTQEFAAPSQPKPKLKKIILLAALGLLFIVLIIGIVVFVVVSNADAKEKKLGSDYIKAVQTSDYKKLSSLIYPPIMEVIDKLGSTDAANITVGEGYKSIVTKSGQVDMVGRAKPTQAKLVSKTSGGGAKHAILTYKVGDNYVSVIEVYDSSGNPHVLTMKEGKDPIKDDAFKSDYDAINRDIKILNSLLDQSSIPQGTNSGQQTSGVKIN